MWIGRIPLLKRGVKLKTTLAAGVLESLHQLQHLWIGLCGELQLMFVTYVHPKFVFVGDQPAALNLSGIVLGSK